MPNHSPPASATLHALQTHAERLDTQALRDLSAARTNALIEGGGWTASLARQYLDADAERALQDFGTQMQLDAAMTALFAGDALNVSEDSPALHWALRADPPLFEAAKYAQASLSPALELAEQIRDGTIRSATGKRFNAIVHVGIGGSLWGPRLLHDTLCMQALAAPHFVTRFCTGLEPGNWRQALAGLDPETCLIIGVTKSFGTEETLHNLTRAALWLRTNLGEAWAQHMVLITSQPQRATQWFNKTGAASQLAALLALPSNIGGRYSLWSAASLVAMIAAGTQAFKQILTGAQSMDAHTLETPLAQNLPMRLALLDYWNAAIRGDNMRVVLPYTDRLCWLSEYLQQLEMESNGKSVTLQGDPLSLSGPPAVWGGEGLLGQHSFYQWLHQSNIAAPIEFVLAPTCLSELDAHDVKGRDAQLIHALAQAETLANGQSLAEIQAAYPDYPEALARQKIHAGGRPSIILYAPKLTPQALGSLLALYEHRTFLAGRLWQINSFDQWGVELGKTIAGHLQNPKTSKNADPVTHDLLQRFGLSK